MGDIADDLEGDETTVFSAELYLLRKIAETSSDLIRAIDCKEFRDLTGGLQKLHKIHEDSVLNYEQWLSDGTE